MVGSNDLCAEQQYTEEQQLNHDPIKSLHDDGLGYEEENAHYFGKRLIEDQ